MGWKCRWRGHQPAHLIVWNRGFGFANCDSCGAEIVTRTGEIWLVPPANTRVVWQSEPPPRALSKRSLVVYRKRGFLSRRLVALKKRSDTARSE